MQGSDFDNLMRSLTESRRSLLGISLGGTLSFLGLARADAKGKKKKKKPCAKKCPDGCCTSKNGKCIAPDQQNATQCGSGGEICRSDCGGRQNCGAGCANGCCTGAGTCVAGSQQNVSQCGSGGETCRDCGANHDCRNQACCGFLGAECVLPRDCCDGGCKDFRCCMPNAGACQAAAECCGNEEQCQNGFCCRLPQSTCENDTKCCNFLPCTNGRCCKPAAGACLSNDECCDGSCILGFCCVPRGAACTSEAQCCAGPCTNGRCCHPNGGVCTFDSDCCEDEDLCEDGQCKRKRGDVCDESIICSKHYPHCILGACNRCQEPAEVSTGTDEICCPFDRRCPNANGGGGACCENIGCCLPDEDGVPCGLMEHMGEGQCG